MAYQIGTSLYEGGDPRFGISPTYLGEAPDIPMGGGMGGGVITGGGGGGTTGGSLITQYPELFEAIPIPEMPEAFTPSALDIGRTQQLTQMFASPAIRQARAAIREALAGRRGSPIQRQYETRGALEGAGQAIETAIAGARQPAWTLAQREAEQADIAEKYRGEKEWKKSLMEYEERRQLQDKMLSERRREFEREEIRKVEKAAAKKPLPYLGVSRLPFGGGGEAPFKPRTYWEQVAGEKGYFTMTPEQRALQERYRQEDKERRERERGEDARKKAGAHDAGSSNGGGQNTSTTGGQGFRDIVTSGPRSPYGTAADEYLEGIKRRTPTIRETTTSPSVTREISRMSSPSATRGTTGGQEFTKWLQDAYGWVGTIGR